MRANTPAGSQIRRERVLVTIRKFGPLTSLQLREIIGVGEKAIDNYLKDLVKTKRVVRDKQGHGFLYRVPG